MQYRSSDALPLLWLNVLRSLQLRVELRWRQGSQFKFGRSIRKLLANITKIVPLKSISTRNWIELAQLEIYGGTKSSQVLEQSISTLRTNSNPEYTPQLDVVMLVNNLAMGGAEIQMSRLASHLSNQGLKVAIVCYENTSIDSNLESSLKLAGIPVFALDKTNEEHGVAPSIAVDPSIGLKLGKLTELLTSIRPKVIHAWLDMAGALALLAGSTAKVPRIVVDTRSLNPTHFETRGVMSIRTIYRALHRNQGVRFVNNSSVGCADYRDWIAEPGLTINHIRNSSPNWQSPEPKQQRRTITIGGLMRLSREKQPELWIKTAETLAKRHPQYQFILYGDGPLKHQLESRLAKQAEPNKIWLKGHCANPQAAIAEFDVLLSTSKVEGTPNTMLEALTLGIPTVAFATGGIPEVLPDDLHYLLSKSSNPEDLAVCVEGALAMSKSDILRAQQYVKHNYSLEKQTEAYLALYQ